MPEGFTEVKIVFLAYTIADGASLPSGKYAGGTGQGYNFYFGTGTGMNLLTATVEDITRISMSSNKNLVI